jgi:SAM-dependent methyltransferase
MTAPSPLAMPMTWDLVSSAYAEEVVPMFERFSEVALERTHLRAGERAVDVATGPGTLAVLAARRGATVDALDFSPGMLAKLRARVESQGLGGVTVHEGDGMALPFADATYDAAYSMFGLFMFPDRARGFAELHRVLRPGGRSAVSSWQPFDPGVPLLSALFAGLQELLPDLPFGDGKAPLGDRDELRAEMAAGGFRDVEVIEVVNGFPAETTDVFFESIERTCAPVALLIRKMGDGWGPVREKLRAKLIDRVGNGPHDVAMPAWVATARK